MPENNNENNITELSEQLFEAIDAIVIERLKKLDFDKTVLATIINIDKSKYGCYEVSTDNNIIFKAYTDISNYQIGDKVYIRIPGGDYTKQKIITGNYIPEDKKKILQDSLQEQINRLQKILNQILDAFGINNIDDNDNNLLSLIKNSEQFNKLLTLLNEKKEE